MRKKSYSDLIPLSIDESSPSPPTIGPKPQRAQPAKTYHLSERPPASVPENTYRGQDPIELPNVERSRSLGMGPAHHNDEQARDTGTHHHHIHHHHYWIRSSSAPPRSVRRSRRHHERHASETPISSTQGEPDPITNKFPSEQKTERWAEHRLPESASRHRHIIRVPPNSDGAAGHKIMSESFSRRREGRNEEHTHIHIYVPYERSRGVPGFGPTALNESCKPIRRPTNGPDIYDRRSTLASTERGGEQRCSTGVPEFEAPEGNEESSRSKSNLRPIKTAESTEAKDGGNERVHRSRVQERAGRKRRHRRSFEDSRGSRERCGSISKEADGSCKGRGVPEWRRRGQPCGLGS